MQIWTITIHNLDSGDRDHCLLSADSDIHAYVRSIFDSETTIILTRDGEHNKGWSASDNSDYNDCEVEATLVTVETYAVAQ
jgi:hypothetical protein